MYYSRCKSGIEPRGYSAIFLLFALLCSFVCGNRFVYSGEVIKVIDGDLNSAIQKAAVTAVSINTAFAGSEKGKQPNILIISVDNVSWFEHSVYGTSNVPTPNVDRIAHEGILFNNGYMSALSCGPSRATMLAGKHFSQLEQAAFMQSFFPKQFATYPQILQANGYETCSVGKTEGQELRQFGMDMHLDVARYTTVRHLRQFLIV